MLFRWLEPKAYLPPFCETLLSGIVRNFRKVLVFVGLIELTQDTRRSSETESRAQGFDSPSFRSAFPIPPSSDNARRKRQFPCSPSRFAENDICLADAGQPFTRRSCRLARHRVRPHSYRGIHQTHFQFPIEAVFTPTYATACEASKIWSAHRPCTRLAQEFSHSRGRRRNRARRAAGAVLPPLREHAAPQRPRHALQARNVRRGWRLNRGAWRHV